MRISFRSDSVVVDYSFVSIGTDISKRFNKEKDCFMPVMKNSIYFW